DVPNSVLLFDVPMMTCVPGGQQTGLVPRLTVTVTVAVAVVPSELVAVKVTVLSPAKNVVGPLRVTVTVPQANDAWAFGTEIAPQLVVLIGGGTNVNTGAGTGSMTIFTVSVPSPPLESKARRVSVWLPIGRLIVAVAPRATMVV